MKKFLVTYHATKEAFEKAEEHKSEDMKKAMEAWNTWAKNCGESLLDMGSPLGKGFEITSAGGNQKSTSACGYSLLQADTIEDVEKLMDGHPHLGWAEGCTIEVHECMPMPG